MNTYTDPDIGKCDDCGSDEGRRVASFRILMFNGEPARVLVWLCRECRRRPRDE